MNPRRIWIIAAARTIEFYRDKSAFGWNFLFPFLIVLGFGFIFGGEEHKEYKVGVFPMVQQNPTIESLALPERFETTKYLEFIGFESLEQGLDKLRHHKVDFLIKNGENSPMYWVGETSPKGYLIEKLLKAAMAPDTNSATREQVAGREIKYIDWLFPGILGMNMMFGALWGVGYVIVRYRKTGVLKRLKATPLTSMEYLSGQMISRLFVLMFTGTIVWIGCQMIFGFYVEGSYLDLAIMFFMGCLSLTSIGILLAARGTSEEFTSGIINFISWPMMFLSEVWFSIEGAPEWIKAFAQIFPLTHMLTGIRKVMNDGAGLVDVMPEIVILTIISSICLVIAASIFSWNK